MNDQEKKEKEKFLINILLSILVSPLLLIGGYFLTQNDGIYKRIIENIGGIGFVFIIILVSSFLISIWSPKFFQKYLIVLLICIEIVTLTFLAIIIKNVDLFTDNSSYIQTQALGVINSITLTQSIKETQSPTPTPTLGIDINSTETPIINQKEEEIEEFINLVNEKIKLGLSNTEKYRDDVYAYFCSTSPKAKKQINDFFDNMIINYCGYGEKEIYLPANFEVERIVQEPIEIDKGEYYFSQIEIWEYTLYPGERNERIDVKRSLYKYSISEIQDSIFCISNYEYEKPPEDVYMGLEKIND